MGAMKELVIQLQDIVIGECFCDWGLFQERISDDKQFTTKLLKCRTHDDIVGLVKQYI